MIYALIPYYNEDTKEFADSLVSQTVPFYAIRRDTRKDRILWTRAMIDFQWLLSSSNRISERDVVCILINDISFPSDYFERGSSVKDGEVLIPEIWEYDSVAMHLSQQGLEIQWENKNFGYSGKIDCFTPRGIFLTVKDFMSVKFNPLLPHYLSDIEWSIRLIKHGVIPKKLDMQVVHPSHSHGDHPIFSWLNPRQPVAWTIFLLSVARNRYLPLNILRSWLEVLR